MKLFIGGLITETNTFSPIPTGRRNYEETALFLGDASQRPAFWGSGVLRVWRDMGEAKGMEVTESLFAMAQPAGPTVRATYDELSGRLVDDLKAAGAVDMILLSLHGAMVADGCDDCEGDILRRMRDVVGDDVTIGIELDLHCHITPAMMELADLIITYKEYPHTDVDERGVELFNICDQIMRGEVTPHLTELDCRMISIWPTGPQPMRGFVDQMIAYEAEPEVLSVSLGHGFPWGNVEHVGARILAYTDEAPERGAAIAEEMHARLWQERDVTGVPAVPMAAALDQAQTAVVAGGSGPVVLSDVSDNAGGGAPGDNTALLKLAMEAGLTNAAFATFWDPMAVRTCFEAGQGARIALRIGGKCGPASGDPLDVVANVKALKRDARQSMKGVSIEMGDCAWIEAGGIAVMLISVRTQTLGLDCFSALGLDPLACDYLFLKSMNHFAAEFAPIAREVIYVAGPGALTVDYASIGYSKLKRAVWPLVADPFAEGAQ